MRAIAVAAAVCLLCVGVADAGLTWLAGEGPPFIFVAGGTGAIRPGDTLTLVVAVGGRYPDDPTAEFHLLVPPALRLLSGDTARAGSLRAISGNYTLKLLTRERGLFDITGRFCVNATGQHDEGGFLMPMDVRGDTVIVEHSHYTLLETVRHGQRYRYGEWLVPLDGTEMPVVEEDLEEGGTRPRVVALTSGVCHGCATSAGTDSVRFAVVIGPDGRVRDTRLLSSPPHNGRPPNPGVVAAAREALRTSTFLAARVNGATVSDWLFVTVPVRRGP